MDIMKGIEMPTKKAFTLIELLVVIAIIALLLSIVLPSLTLVKGRAREVASMTNMRSLMTAWLLYADENDSKLVSSVVWPTTSPEHWVFPVDPSLSISDHEKELAGIRNGALWPYLEDVEAYHSPGDRNWRTETTAYTQWMSPYRSYAISDSMNGNVRPDYMYRKLGNIKSPASRFVFTEEDDNNGANSSSWILGNPGTNSWWDPLAAWYSKGTGSIFGFADGHADKRIWENQGTRDWIESKNAGYTPPADDSDFMFIQRSYYHNYR